MVTRVELLRKRAAICAAEMKADREGDTELAEKLREKWRQVHFALSPAEVGPLPYDELAEPDEERPGWEARELTVAFLAEIRRRAKVKEPPPGFQGLRFRNPSMAMMRDVVYRRDPGLTAWRRARGDDAPADPPQGDWSWWRKPTEPPEATP